MPKQKPPPSPDRIDRISTNILIANKIKARSYLEIGCRDDSCFKHITRDNIPSLGGRIGVDPVEGGTARMYSDDYFENLDRHTPDLRFDLIFIDGDHRHPQVVRDMRNALRYLSDDGVITMHDVFPPTPAHEDASLCGTVWRAFLWEGRMQPSVEAFTAIMSHDVDVGILRKRPNSFLIVGVPAPEELTYAQLRAHEHDWARRMPLDRVLRALDLG